MKFSIKTNNVENVLLVDGITRTGKFLLSKIVSEFEDIEFFQSLPVLEHIPYMFGLGGMGGDAAISLIKSTIDYAAYDQFLGRGLNHRVLDRSSIYNSSDSASYLKRHSSFTAVMIIPALFCLTWSRIISDIFFILS